MEKCNEDDDNNGKVRNVGQRFALGHSQSTIIVVSAHAFAGVATAITATISIASKVCIFGTRGRTCTSGMSVMCVKSHKSLELDSTFKGGQTETTSTTGLRTRSDSACPVRCLAPIATPAIVAIDLPRCLGRTNSTQKSDNP